VTPDPNHATLPSVPRSLAGRTILQIIPELDAGGAERTTIDVAAALAEAGARPLVASMGGRLVSELQAKGGVWIPFPAKTKNPFLMARNVLTLSKLIREEGVDIVHARSRAPAWTTLYAARRTKRPFVTTYHGTYNGQSAIKIHYNSIMARGDAVIANSEFTASRIVVLHPFAQDRVRVIQRGTDLRKFAAASVTPERVRRLRSEWGVEADERIVLLPGRLTGWKGQRVLIEAARLLFVKGVQDVKFIMVGDDQGRSAYVDDLKSRISAGGLEGVAKIAGHCADMPAAYLAASVVTVPSTEPEAFGRVAVEAQAIGTPVVVSDLGAVGETVLAPPQVDPASRRMMPRRWPTASNWRCLSAPAPRTPSRAGLAHTSRRIFRWNA
jgi:glycosyltransferase involved in cell wall biosynthesis